MKTKSNVAASSGYLDRIVRLFRSVWRDVGITPADAAQAILAGFIVGIPVMAVVWATAWVICRLTGKPLDDSAMTASVGVLFLGLCLLRAVIYLRDKWRESSKPNAELTDAKRSVE